MSDQFVAEIRMVGFNFAPRGWATCDGQIMPISQNTALFSLLGVTYGGDGKSTFALPNLQGCVPMAQGQGPGLTPRDLGESGGTSAVPLSTQELPLHNHPMRASTGDAGDSRTPSPSVSLSVVQPGALYNPSVDAIGAMSLTAVGLQGKSGIHNNMMPYTGMLYIIALQGIFPSRP